jgi:hypothetical protein
MAQLCGKALADASVNAQRSTLNLQPAKGSGRFQLIGFEFDGGGLADEVEAEENSGHAVTFFDPAFHAAEGAGFDEDAHAFADLRGEQDLQVSVQGEENVVQLPGEEFLVEDLEEIGHVFALVDFLPLGGEHFQEEIPGEEGFEEGYRFASVFADGAVEGQGGGDVFLGAVLLEFLFAARPGMGHEPNDTRDVVLNFHVFTMPGWGRRSRYVVM